MTAVPLYPSANQYPKATLYPSMSMVYPGPATFPGPNVFSGDASGLAASMTPFDRAGATMKAG